MMLCVQNVCLYPISIFDKICDDVGICHQRASSYTILIIYHYQECVTLANIADPDEMPCFVGLHVHVPFSHAFGMFHKCVF